MLTRRSLLKIAGAGSLLMLLAVTASSSQSAVSTLPAALTDAEFWALSAKISEPDGFFRSQSGSPDNLLSNEIVVSSVAAALQRVVKPSGVYLGVGPEQNFTYIAAAQPRLAFITDIRRGNLHLHLLYKALFELSSDRATFAARLFSRKVPAGVGETVSAATLMSAVREAVPLDQAGHQANLKMVLDHLMKTRGLPLGTDDQAGITYVYGNFHRFGPAIHYTSSIGGGASATPYSSIVSSRDSASGEERTFLANAANYSLLRDMQRKNLIVPVVGDFAGPKALRAIGTYLRAHGAVLGAFYVSNVEDYLNRNGTWQAFCANVASMPLDTSSVFIRPTGRAGSFNSMLNDTAGCR